MALNCSISLWRSKSRLTRPRFPLDRFRGVSGVLAQPGRAHATNADSPITLPEPTDNHFMFVPIVEHTHHGECFFVSVEHQQLHIILLANDSDNDALSL